MLTRARIGAELADPSEECKPIDISDQARRNNTQHPFLINMEQSVELAIINSREFQARREALYLAALPVTQERFALAPQGDIFGMDYLNKFGRDATGGPARQWSLYGVAGVAQVFCTGALLLFNFANQTVYNFGQIQSTSISTMSLDFIQPFLQGAGLAVTLEPLTQAERNLLYEIRDYYKFRQEFFVFIAAGQAAFIPGVQPGVLAFSNGTVTAPIPALTTRGVTPTVLSSAIGAPAVTTQVTVGTATVLQPVAPPGATTQGYLSTIYEKANLVVTYQNIDAVRRFLQIFRVYLEGGIVALAQVNQVEQRLLTSTENALNAQVSYRISLDQFKFQMGIPQTLDIDLDSEPLEPMFKLIRKLDRLSKDQQTLTDKSAELSGQIDTSNLREQYRNLLATAAMTRGTQAARTVQRLWDDWAGLSNVALELRINSYKELHRALLSKKTKAPENRLSEADQKELARVEEELHIGGFEQFLRLVIEQAWKKIGSPNPDQKVENRYLAEQLQFAQRLRTALVETHKRNGALIVLSALGPTTAGLNPWVLSWSAETMFRARDLAVPPAELRRLQQLNGDVQQILIWETQRADQSNRVRNGLHRNFLAMVEEAFDERQKEIAEAWPCLPKVCVNGVDLLSAPEDIALAALQKAALTWRVDLMNFRGELVDAWREIRVAANSLLGIFNVQYHGDWGSPNPGYHPLAIGGSNYHQQLLFNWSLPLVRIAQRNMYRAALINFQAARRRLMAAEDDVLFGVRIDFRNVRAFAYNFHHIQKRQIVLAYQQVDVALQAFSQPQIPSGPAGTVVGQPSASNNIGDPAALTNQLLTAQNSLLGAKPTCTIPGLVT